MSVASPSERRDDEELAGVTARLSREFGPETEQGPMAELVATCASRWAGARVRTYVPVLVERSVRHRLLPRQLGESVEASAGRLEPT